MSDDEEASNAPRARTFACSACGASYAAAAWGALPLRERIDPSDVRRLVRDWPESTCIEIRSCTQCGHTIAAKHVSEARRSALVG
jgi:hypothetical protein